MKPITIQQTVNELAKLERSVGIVPTMTPAQRQRAATDALCMIAQRSTALHPNRNRFVNVLAVLGAVNGK